MEKKKIIVISGKQFSGKDTVANTLKTVLEDFKLAPLADAIKIEFGEEKNLTFNEIAQMLGEPLNTVKSRYRRGLVLLRETIPKI